GRLPAPAGSPAGTPSPLFWPTWTAQRLSGNLGPDEQRAAQNALVHAGTKSTAHVDAAGRIIMSLSVNNSQNSGGPLKTEELMVRQYFDIQGHALKVIDAN